MANLMSERVRGKGKDILERVYVALLDARDYSLENWEARQTVADLLHTFPSRANDVDTGEDQVQYSDEVEGDYAGEEN